MGEDYELRGPEAVKVLRLLPKEPKADDKKEVCFVFPPSSIVLLHGVVYIHLLVLSKPPRVLRLLPFFPSI